MQALNQRKSAKLDVHVFFGVPGRAKLWTWSSPNRLFDMCDISFTRSIVLHYDILNNSLYEQRLFALVFLYSFWNLVLCCVRVATTSSVCNLLRAFNFELNSFIDFSSWRRLHWHFAIFLLMVWKLVSMPFYILAIHDPRTHTVANVASVHFKVRTIYHFLSKMKRSSSKINCFLFFFFNFVRSFLRNACKIIISS